MSSAPLKLTLTEEAVRGALTRAIAELGRAPALDELASRCGLSADATGAALDRLHATHSLLLHPESRRPWAVHPFALAPGSCWVATAERGYWANCLYCGFGILAALGQDGAVHTRLGGEHEAVVFHVQDGGLVDDLDYVFHLSTPVAKWWDNVIFACSSFQPFRDEREIDAWCARHDLPRGATMSLLQLWRFAGDWYGGYLQVPWKKRSAAEAAALFARHGLDGPFWSVGAT